MINRLHESFTEGDTDDVVKDVLEDLVEYTKEHFSAEQNMMEEAGYPALEPHKKFHKHLVEKLESISEDVKSGKMMVGLKVMDFLKSWLTDHIMEKDKAYAPHLKQHGW